MSAIEEVFIRSVETAVGQSMGQNKPLLVYISATENDNVWLDAALSKETLNLMKDKAICLRLIQGSSEFQMFEQFFSKVVVPSIYCIRNSVICDVLHGLDTQQFNNRIVAAINGERHPEAEPIPIVHSTETTIPATTSAPVALQNEQAQQEERQSSPVSPAPRPASSASPSPALSTGSNKKFKSLKEQSAEMAAKAYKEDQLRKARLAREEKERVKRLLKADEEERRLQNRRKDEERERQRRLSNDEDVFNDEHCIDEIIHENKSLRDNIYKRAPSTSGDVCALAIRLLDGSSLRHNFQVTNTLNDVREWVDANRSDGDEPYCFHRTIPRTTFGVTDEERTLEALELAPRSALILKPFASFTNAYSNTGSQQNNGGIFSRIYNRMSSFWSGEPTTIYTNHPNSSTQTQSHGPQQYHDENEVTRQVSIADPTSASTSQFVSPLHSPNLRQGADLEFSHPSGLNLNLNVPETNSREAFDLSSSQNLSRAESPNTVSTGLARIRTLDNTNSFDDRTTYNGNHVNLEDDPSK